MRDVTRRRVLQWAALGRAGAAPPSDRVGVACIGTGWQGGNNVKSFLEIPEARVVAVCDVDAEHLEDARRTVNETYGNRDCAAVREFEAILARADVDAVVLSVPDHWHGVLSVAAVRAGKDVYGEKPLAHNFVEGAAIRDAVRRYGRVWQTGSWQRSLPQFRRACELVRNGRIGKIHRVEVGLPGGHTDFDGRGHETAPGPPPPALDYDRWLGPAPAAPYCPARVHKTWRWHSDYGGGMLMDWVGHHLDIAHWALDLDATGPYEVEGRGEFPAGGSLWNTATRFRVLARYAGGLEIAIAGGYDEIRRGTKWIGDRGWLWVDRAGIEAHPRRVLASKIGPGEVRLDRAPGHHEQFIECVRTRGRTLSPPDVALRSATPGWLGVVSMSLGRKIRWDPVRERAIDDPEAARRMGRAMRSPWSFEI
jgi:predicted dehydrogenase